jgi:hypothetical protein
MGKYNGSGILLYADGVEIAAQKSFSISANQNLFDTTNKQSLGWAEHGNGLRDAEVPFENLQSTTGLSDKELYDFINLRKSLMLSILGFTYPIVMKVDLSNMTINAPLENAVGLSGTFKADGAIVKLSGAHAQLFADWTNTDYDTFTKTGTKITSGINASGGASALSSTSFSAAPTDNIRVFIAVTLTSGQLPSLDLVDHLGASMLRAGVTVPLVAGVNLVTFDITGTDGASKLKILNTAAANFSTSNVYVTKS